MKRLLYLICLVVCSLTCYAQKVIPDSKEQLSQEVKEYIGKHLKGMGERALVKACDDLTCKLLKFSYTSKNPNLSQLRMNKELDANCVGYAKAYKAIMTYALKVNNIKGKVTHYRGPVKVKGVDITNIVSKSLGLLSKRAANFTKDHDYCVVVIGKNSYTIDSSLSDVSILN
ncbi:MAG: hypothetical protein HUK09_04075 [Bacteroidaceae bacterium]|nr:hypothetical protein [Bacteroidaceae bacterium]